MAEGDQTAAASNTDGEAGLALQAQAQPLGADGDEPMQTELEMVSMERDDYRRKLESVEAELAALTGASPDADTINKLQQDNEHLRKTLRKATDMLREKMTLCNVQEKKNSALTQQVKTLKEVLQVTRDLLNIRNLEVEQLQKNVDSMEVRIDDNRRRQTAMIKQLEQATKINGELRNEYETQLKIFQSLKERYEEKVAALTNLAKQRQRVNSEGSEKFEDAPETADATVSANEAEAANEAEVANEPKTDSVPQIKTMPEISSVPETSTSETASETSSVFEASTPEISSVPGTNLPVIALETTPVPEASTPGIAPEIATVPETSSPGVAPEIATVPETSSPVTTSEMSNAQDAAHVS